MSTTTEKKPKQDEVPKAKDAVKPEIQNAAAI